MATVFGIPAGLLLAVLLLFFTSAAILGDGKSHAELTVVVVAQTVFFAALAGFAIRFCSRGRAGLGAFLIVIGIVAAVPVGACDAVGFDQHYPIQL